MINPRCPYVFSEHSEMSQEKKQRTFSIDLFFSKPLNVLFCCEENKGSNWAVDEHLHHKLSVVVLMVSNSDPLLSAMVSEEEVAGEQMQGWTLLLPGICPPPEQEETGRAGSSLPTHHCYCL